MGRPEAPIDADGGPVAGFAAGLRRLRAQAGSPTYRQLAARTRFAPSVLSAAARGTSLATWPVTRAFVLACGGDVAQWQEHWREVSDAVHPAIVEGRPARTVVRTLPADTRAFTGRGVELARLLELADGALSGQGQGSGTGAGVIAAIDGMAGVGKTALVLHAGHLLSDRFPDGQLFLDLHGHTEGLAPRDPGDALAALLAALGLAPEQVPADPQARAAALRDRLADTRTLLVLDNAASEAQVRPLLPAEEGCLVLVTSRRRLKALDDAHTLTLDVLPVADAVELLRRVAGIGGGGHDGEDEVRDEDALIEEIAELCGRLPLALRIAAALIRHRPAGAAHHLAHTLRRGAAGLEGFFDGDRDLAAVFDLSYRRLSQDAQVLFRRLGLVPGPEVDGYGAAALLGGGLISAERLLGNLADHNLLDESEIGRYRMLDLIRRHARALSEQDSAEEREAAAGRLLDYYAHTAQRADAAISFPCTWPGPSGPGPAHSPDLADQDTARAWLRTERANLLAAIASAGAHADEERLVALTAGLATLLGQDGPWPVAIELFTAAAQGADRRSDRYAHAHALTILGSMRLGIGQYPSAVHDLEQARDLFRSLGEDGGQANALTVLATTRYMTDDVSGALRDVGQAVELKKSLGGHRGQADALLTQGNIRILTNDFVGAIPDLEQARDLYRDLGERTGQATALLVLGEARRVTGRYPDALQDLEQALTLFRAQGNLNAQARALYLLGDVRRMLGKFPAALGDLEQALEIQRGLGDRSGQAGTLTIRGAVRSAIGELSDAVRDLEQALEVFRQIGDRGNEAFTLNHFAAALTVTGDRERALIMYGDALSLARETDQFDEQALALEGIGECHLQAGQTDDGTAHLAQALAIFRQYGMAQAERVRTRLDFSRP
jgi:tetratricopeptide (TPR) repeat protein